MTEINWPAFRRGFGDAFTLRPLRSALRELIRTQARGTIRVPKRESDERVMRIWKKEDSDGK